MGQKVSISKKTVLLIHPVLVIGSYDKNEQPNIMTASWGGICCSEPPCVAVSLRKATYTYQNLIERKAYTVNIPSIQYIEQTDYVGIYSGRNENKFDSTGLTAVKSHIVDAPYIDEFPLVLHCKIIHTIEIGLHTQFIGEIVDIQCDKYFLNNENMPDINKIQPFIYDNSSRSYYSIGDKVLKAFSSYKI